MAIEDRNGALHGESDGRFVSKGKSDEAKIRETERIYGPSNEYYNQLNSEHSGALEPFSEKATEHAFRYYAFVRKRKDDVSKIAKNSGFSKKEIQSIKNYIFIQEHELKNGKGLFFPSYAISQSWQRLSEGKYIKEMDIVFLKHELLEMHYLQKGLSHDDAHQKAEQKYNYAYFVKQLEKER